MQRFYKINYSEILPCENGLFNETSILSPTPIVKLPNLSSIWFVRGSNVAKYIK